MEDTEGEPAWRNRTLQYIPVRQSMAIIVLCGAHTKKISNLVNSFCTAVTSYILMVIFLQQRMRVQCYHEYLNTNQEMSCSVFCRCTDALFVYQLISKWREIERERERRKNHCHTKCLKANTSKMSQWWSICEVGHLALIDLLLHDIHDASTHPHFIIV